MLNFIKIKAIRPSLTTAACHTLVLKLCISHLDYTNALLYGMTKKLKSRYQRIQNMCAKLNDAHTVLMKMKNKHCKLDTIPMGILKQILEACLPAITQIVNMSLTNREFCKSWKVTIVKPLLKKPGLNLVSKNYRPISNLPFISKLVEKCMLKQLIEHCKNPQPTP